MPRESPSRLDLEAPMSGTEPQPAVAVKREEALLPARGKRACV